MISYLDTAGDVTACSVRGLTSAELEPVTDVAPETAFA